MLGAVLSRGQIPLIEPPCSAGSGGTSGVIHLPWQAHSGRRAGEAGPAPYKTNISAARGTPAVHCRLFFGFFFLIGLTWQFSP